MTQRPDDLHRQVEAAKQLRLQIALLVAGESAEAIGQELSEDDRRAIQDTFEGETSLDVELERAIAAEDEDLILIEGIRKREDELSARRKRYEKRKEARRGLIEQAMTVAGWKKKETALGTLSLGRGSAKVATDDESKIPVDYWKRAEPTLDKTTLGAALREHKKAVEEALKIRDAYSRSEALLRLSNKLPQAETVNARIIDAVMLNDPDAQCEALAAILASTSPIPGCHLEIGGPSLTVTRR